MKEAHEGTRRSTKKEEKGERCKTKARRIEEAKRATG